MEVMVINKKLKQKLYSIFVISLLILQTCFGVDEHHFVKVIKEQTSQDKPKFKFTLPDKTISCQTLTYLRQKDLKHNTESELNRYSNNPLSYYNKKISNSFLENLVNKSIEKELELKKDYYVFYHGQRLEFLLFQDVFEKLYNICHKKILHDFFMLRIPETSYKFEEVKNFLIHYFEKNKAYSFSDYDTEIRNLLLSVNTSLFGNLYSNKGSCSLDYFLTSNNCFTINDITLIEGTFNFFNLNNIFIKYKIELNSLLALLNQYDYGKTGVLLQIFVPKNKIDEIAYRCVPGGRVYYSNQPHEHLAQSDLLDFQNGQLSSSPYSSEIDSIQFRLMLNDKFLNPDSGIKMFRYVNETEKIKEYKQNLITLFQKIENELSPTPQKLKLQNGKKSKRRKR